MPFEFVKNNPLIDDPAGTTAPQGEPGMILFDMHVHSVYSSDSINSIDTIFRAWKSTGILPLVCDHDSIMGSRKICRAIKRADPDIPEVLAEEILTADGEIVGAFLNEEIRPGLSADETLDIIEDQGAISIVPHPFCTFRSTTIDTRVLEDVIGRIDIVEGYNARTPDLSEGEAGLSLAELNEKPVSGGSDAHTPVELARNYTVLDSFETPDELISNLKKAEFHFAPAPSVVHDFTIMYKKMKRQNPGWSLRAAVGDTGI